MSNGKGGNNDVNETKERIGLRSSSWTCRPKQNKVVSALVSH